MKVEIKALSPELEESYLDFFDHRAFSDGSPYYPCYCNAFNMSAAQIERMRDQAKRYGEGVEGWKNALRQTAAHMVREGMIQGYLAFDKGLSIGWCNANDRMNYFRVGAFDLDHIPKDHPPHDCRRKGQIKSIVCFEISPEYRGMGIAAQLLDRVCADAKEEGYAFVEEYPMEEQQTALAFTGPLRLYEKAGFAVFSQDGSTVIMRKKL